ncbi:MAG: 3-isopropylmalate dehydratase [Candidatus Binatia bacterium]
MGEGESLLFKGKVWRFGDNISTDLIMPGLVYSKMASDQEIAKYCMYANRPGWAGQVGLGDIVVARRNFGCGSSRPAPRMLKTLGISVVVAESMSRLFFRNSVNVGFPVLICPRVHDAFEEGDLAEVNAETGEVKNLTRGTVLMGEALSSSTPPYQILRAGGLEPLLREVVAKLKGGAGR